MPHVTIIEPDLSPLVINTNSFHLADVLYYLHSVTVWQLLTIKSGLRSQIHLVVTVAQLKSA